MSSSDCAIRVEGLGKQYRLGLEQAGTAYRYKSLRDSLGGVAKRPLQAIKNAVVRAPMNETNSFWALKDINFDVKKGEVVGIIGRNGAGKSTLLKILSRITKPTTGQVNLFGRVGSLLEVGTGFHPELSGRENIYLNGAVLGMTRAEVKAKFDEIVAFSEIEKFLDTAVKQYSSGMYTRLAFAVAAHLNSEILIVDEVLAVGDGAFQKKCIGKMNSMSNTGKTVLVVSHNMAILRQLCTEAILLEAGRKTHEGSKEKVISEYMNSDLGGVATNAKFTPDTGKSICITKVVLRAPAHSTALLQIDETLQFEIQYRIHEALIGANVSFTLFRDGTAIFNTFDTDCEPHLHNRRLPGDYITHVRIPPFAIKAGLYTASFDAGITGMRTIDEKADAIRFELEETCEDTSLKGYSRSRIGLVVAPVTWCTTKALFGVQ